MQWRALDAKGNALVQASGDTEEEARADVERSLRRNRGRAPFLKKWEDGGRRVEAIVPLTPEQEAEIRQSTLRIMAESREKAVVDSIERIAVRLEMTARTVRAMKADVGMETDLMIGRLGGPLKQAERVQHEVLWMLANLNLDTLTAQAADAEQTRAAYKAQYPEK